MRLTLLAILMLLVALPALAIDHNGTSATLGWTAASGSVAGYEVHVRRGTGGSLREQDVTGLAATITGVAGESVIVRVRAYTAGKALLGPFSIDSDQVTFRPVAAPGTPGKPTWRDLVLAWLRKIMGRTT